MIMADKEAKTNLRLPEELYEQIRALAGRELRSINAQMVKLLQEAIEARQRADEQLARDREALYGKK